MEFTGKDALVLFYGVFWAISLSKTSRYRLFETDLLFSKERRRYAILRFLMGFIFIDVSTVLWFWFLYTSVLSEDAAGVFPIMAAAFASLSVFGFHRILHAVVATKNLYSKFYSDKEWDSVINQWGGEHPNTFISHFLPGICYLIVFSAIAFFVGKL